MAMTAMFRMKWGHKPQVVQAKPQAPVPHLPSEDDDDDDETLPSRAPIRRNSRFYRSMRKKKLSSSSEQQEIHLLALESRCQATGLLCWEEFALGLRWRRQEIGRVDKKWKN
ncbi:hypothetical protein cypCar_00020744 [Cyprinus carpio]|nr:hypothetical protein cypCar_00020744 [Cyprinus carpio]